ncbi:MAG: DUF1207 domain-containing protein [Elusimicrobia bacterium]|nr:DUF1207 domain-containing protein [Elusimicrobiota bacterium]
MLLLLALTALAPAARARDFVYGVVPETDQLFHRLLADPRQPQTSIRYYRLRGLNMMDVSLGNTWGAARWRAAGTGGNDWFFQFNVSGMGYSRFHVTGGVNEFQTIDFFAEFPLEVRHGPFAAQATPFHESSHLGDDYIRRTSDTGFRYSAEGVRVILSYDLGPYVRVYGGGLGYLHDIPRGQDGAAQYGLELRTAQLDWIKTHECWLYLAQDFQNQGRSDWNLDSNTQLGLRMGVPKVVRDLRFHVDHFDGRSQFGQFTRDHESSWDAGVTFDF